MCICCTQIKVSYDSVDDAVEMQGHLVVDRIQGFVYFVNTIHTDNPRHWRREMLQALD